MAVTTDTTPLDEFFDDTLFTGSYAKATKGFATLGNKILAARAKAQEAVQLRNQKKDAVVTATVAQAIAWDAVRPALESFDRQVDAFFDKDRAGYREVFPQTTSQISRTTEGRRAEAMKPVLAFAARPGLQGRLAATAKDLAAAWRDYADAARASAQAAEDLAKAYKAVAAAKHAAVVMMREADGTLRAANADNPKAARKFFRVKGGSEKAEEPGKPEGPAQPDPDVPNT